MSSVLWGLTRSITCVRDDANNDLAADSFPLRAGLLRYAARLGLTIENPEMLSERPGTQSYFFDDRIPADQLLKELAKEDGLDVEIQDKHVRFSGGSGNDTASGTRDASPLPQSRLENLPPYPAEAAKQKIAGKLLLIVDVDAHGRPTAVEVERAEPVGVFDAAAKDAIMKWRFEPRLEDGKPVAGRVRVPIEFAPDANAAQG